MKNCVNCHTENNEGNKFCVKCGLPFTEQKLSISSVSCSKPGVANNKQGTQQFIKNHPKPKSPQSPLRASGTPRPIRRPQRRNSNEEKRNFIPILLTIFSLAIIVGAIMFWMFRDSLFGPNIKEFVADFAEKASKNQIDSLRMVYPGIEYADSVALKYVEDGIVIINSKDKKTFEILLSPDVRMFVEKNGDGHLQVTDTKGLFLFPVDKLNIAKKTGMWNESLSDKELSNRIKDDEYFDYLNRIRHIDKDDILTVNTNLTSFGDDLSWGDRGFYTITNHTNQTIAGTDYMLNFRDEHTLPFMAATYNSYSEPGKEIPPHGIIKIEGSWDHAGSGHYEEDHHLIGVTMLLSSEELQEKFAPFTGKEYQQYLDSKK